MLQFFVLPAETKVGCVCQEQIECTVLKIYVTVTDLDVQSRRVLDAGKIVLSPPALCESKKTTVILLELHHQL